MVPAREAALRPAGFVLRTPASTKQWRCSYVFPWSEPGLPRDPKTSTSAIWSILTSRFRSSDNLHEMRLDGEGQPKLVGTQSLHHVYVGSACCRHGGCDDRGGQKHKGRANNRKRAGHNQVRAIVFRKTGKRIPADSTRNYSYDGHDHAFPNDSGEQAIFVGVYERAKEHAALG